MDISIIIGLLVALVIVCATTVVNNLINKDFYRLKKLWDERGRVISVTLERMVYIEKNLKALEELDKSEDSSFTNSIKSIRFQCSVINSEIKDFEEKYF